MAGSNKYHASIYGVAEMAAAIIFHDDMIDASYCRGETYDFAK